MEFSPFVLCILGLLTIVGATEFGSDSKVEHLTDKIFTETIESSKGLSIVMFYAPWCGHCKNFAPEFGKASKKMAGVVHFAAVDCTTEKKICHSMAIKGYPTVKVFSSDKKKPLEYDGGRTASSVVKYLIKHIESFADTTSEGSASGSSGKYEDPKNDGDVVVLKGTNFDSFIKSTKLPVLVKFFAPWCGHCKNMYDDYKKAATELKKVSVLAEVDATIETDLAARFDVRGYPALFYFDKKTGDYGKTSYDGGRSTEDLVSWISAKAGVPLEEFVLSEINSQEGFKKDCLSKSVCVLAFLPSIEDSSVEERKKQLKLLHKMGDSLNSPGWGWAWIEGGSQNDLEESLRVDSLSYPFLITIHASRNVFTVMPKDPSESTIKEYITSLKTRKIKVINDLPKLPELKTTKPFQKEEL